MIRSLILWLLQRCLVQKIVLIHTTRRLCDWMTCQSSSPGKIFQVYTSLEPFYITAFKGHIMLSKLLSIFSLLQYTPLLGWRRWHLKRWWPPAHNRHISKHTSSPAKIFRDTPPFAASITFVITTIIIFFLVVIIIFIYIIVAFVVAACLFRRRRSDNWSEATFCQSNLPFSPRATNFGHSVRCRYARCIMRGPFR